MALLHLFLINSSVSYSLRAGCWMSVKPLQPHLTDCVHYETCIGARLNDFT